MQLGDERKPGTFAIVAGEKVQIRIEEVFKRIDHVPTAKEKRDQEVGHWSFAPKWDHVATGCLRFRIDEYVDGARKMWTDRDSQPLEERLNEVVKGILFVAEALRLRHLEWERRERERQEEERRRAELERLQREEEARRQELEQFTNRWVKSQNLRAFLEAVQQEAVRRALQLTPDTAIGRWLAWGREHADRLDPLTSGLLPTLGP